MKFRRLPFFFSAAILTLFVAGAVSLEADRIAAVAQVVPALGLVELDGPAGDHIEEVLVSEGETVTAGQALLRLHGLGAARAELAQAVASHQELLAQQGLALRHAEITAEQAQAEADFARRTVERAEAGGVERMAPQMFDGHQHAARMAAWQAEAATAAWSALRATQPAARARAEAAVAAAQARVVRSTVSAPQGGTILRLDAVSGGATGRGRPLVVLADLSRMAVVGDVFEGDLARVAVGQTAQVTSRSLPGPVAGRVVHVGRLIAGAGKTGRVTVEMETATELARLINAEVDLMIEQ